MKIISRSHIGNVRENNEDFVYNNLTGVPKYALVADGMGGAAAGEIASKIAAFSVGQFFSGNKKPINIQIVKEAVYYANSQILNETKNNIKLQGMGTTMTLACFCDKKILIAHVGDSAAYLITKNKIEKITKDHTYVQKLIDSGILKKEKADDYPLKNIITRVVGMEELEVDGYKRDWEKGDFLFLCTDGLSNYIKQEEIFSVISGASDLDSKADKLLSSVLERGGRDNVSFLIAQNSDDEV